MGNVLSDVVDIGHSTPQGEVISHVLFEMMMNYKFTSIDNSFG